jgi:hypothetical protein
VYLFPQNTNKNHAPAIIQGINYMLNEQDIIKHRINEGLNGLNLLLQKEQNFTAN